jgi:hypothetical protein
MDGLPFRSGECYPDAVPIGSETVLAFGCGEIALSEADGGWTRLHGGLTTETVEAHGSRYQLWRFATLIPAGDVVFFDAEGITVDPDGVPCYGCPDSPTSLWAFRLR